MEALPGTPACNLNGLYVWRGAFYFWNDVNVQPIVKWKQKPVVGEPDGSTCWVLGKLKSIKKQYCSVSAQSGFGKFILTGPCIFQIYYFFKYFL